MSMKVSLLLLVAFAAAACTKTVTLTETTPVQLSARAPELPPPPPPPPPVVEVTKEKIEVREKIQFELGKAIIRPESFGLMNTIADVINKHPEIKKLRIEGHTCTIGTRAKNLQLSKARAKAVLDYLVQKGKVTAARLVMDGYGPDKPIASNDDEAGRVQNRRVEFNILERAQ